MTDLEIAKARVNELEKLILRIADAWEIGRPALRAAACSAGAMIAIADIGAQIDAATPARLSDGAGHDVPAQSLDEVMAESAATPPRRYSPTLRVVAPEGEL